MERPPPSIPPASVNVYVPTPHRGHGCTRSTKRMRGCELLSTHFFFFFFKVHSRAPHFCCHTNRDQVCTRSPAKWHPPCPLARSVIQSADPQSTVHVCLCVCMMKDVQLKQPLGCPKPADFHKDLIFSLLSDSVFGFVFFVFFLF